MAYMVSQANNALNSYLKITDSDKKYIEGTKKRGFVYQLNNGENVVIFLYPLVHKADNTKNYFDTRDSGSAERTIAWKYSIEHDLKYFCLGVNDSVEKYKDYIFSLECHDEIVEEISGTKNGIRAGKGNQIIIPNDFVPKQRLERIRNKIGVFISVIYKEEIREYLERFDNRPYMGRLIHDKLSQSAENSDDISLIDNTCNLPQNRIISGAPGTGKSYKYETEKDEYFSEYQYERVTFHPAYSYAHFFGCYKPVNGAEGIEYKFVPGPFVRVWLKAMADPEHNYLLLIEEINRAEVAAVFGDVFQLLDRKDGISQYPIDMSEDLRKYISNGEWQENIKTSMEEIDISQKMVIPQNMFIWATMNSADQGVYPMDTAFKRRWDYEYMPLDNKDVEKKLDTRNIQLVREKAGSEYKVQRFTWNEVRMAINNFLSGANINEDKLMGPFFLSDSVVGAGRDAVDEIEFWKKFEEAFQNKVLLYLFEDAGKSKRPTLFEGAKPNHNRYSCIREEFANKGMRIFHEDISNKLHYYHNVDEAKQQEQNNKGETYEGSQP